MMARQYVTYEQVLEGLQREGLPLTFVDAYLMHLRAETGLSWAKLAHDLSVDSGCKVSAENAKRWANG
jgi:hypothetical protein